MEMMSVASRSTSGVPKEEEEFGRFFEKLADLVPKSTRVCSQLMSDCVVVQHSIDINSRNNARNLNKDYDSILDYNTTDASVYDCEFTRSSQTENLIKANNKESLVYSESIPSSYALDSNPTIAETNINFKSNNQYLSSRRLSHSKAIRPYHAIKPCKVRNRPAPYKINKHDITKYSHTSDMNHSRCSGNRSHLHNNNHASPAVPETEERLELLTDVIEYIHNLKSLLENAQGQTTAADLPSRPRIPSLESMDSQRRASHQNRPEGSRYHTENQEDAATASTRRASEMQPPAGVDRSIKLVECGATVPQGGSSSTSYLLVDPVPTVDRAMELLEYKTGAITLTA